MVVSMITALRAKQQQLVSVDPQMSVSIMTIIKEAVSIVVAIIIIMTTDLLHPERVLKTVPSCSLVRQPI